MKNLKLFFAILVAAGAAFGLAALNLMWRPANIVPPMLPDVPELSLDAARITSSLPKGTTLNQVGLDNVMRQWRDQEDPTDKPKPIPPPPTIDDMVKLQGIAIIGSTTRGAIIELMGAAAPKNIAAAQAAATRVIGRPNTTPQLERVTTVKSSAESSFTRSRFFKEGQKFDLPKGPAVFKSIVSDSMICVNYLDSDYYLTRRYDYIALNEIMSTYKDEAAKPDVPQRPAPLSPTATPEERAKFQEDWRKYREAMRAQEAAARGTTAGPGGGPGGGAPSAVGEGGRERWNRGGNTDNNTMNVRPSGGNTPGGNTGGGGRGGRGGR